MELRKINRWLRRIGLVLVITCRYDGENLTEPTRLWIARYSSYQNGAVTPGLPEWRLKR